MDIKDFLKIELTKLAKQFRSVEIKYAYDLVAKDHIVETNPELGYYNNMDLGMAKMDITEKFIHLFPFEGITFVSSDSLLRIEHPEFWFNKSEAVYHSFFETPPSEDWMQRIEAAFIDSNDIIHKVIYQSEHIKSMVQEVYPNRWLFLWAQNLRIPRLQ